MDDALKRHIVDLLHKESTPRRLGVLQAELGIGREYAGMFREAVEALCAEGRVIVGAGDKVRLASLSGEVTGVFRGHARGYGFVSPQQFADEGDVFIAAKAVGTAMSGDRVVVEIKRGGKGKDADQLTGRIVKVIERAHSRVVGALDRVQGEWVIRPDGGDFLRAIEVEGVDACEARKGDKVVVEIRQYPTSTRAARGVVEEVLGRPGRHDAEISAIIRKYGLSEEFDESSLVEAWNAKSSYDPADTQGREDLREWLIVTIDPADAQDFDDAISLSRGDDGSWELGVHIADVSHFVAKGSALDRAARRRGNSVYLPGRVVPMLPEMLSNEICSLGPGQGRYTKSVFLTYGKDGEFRSARFANTIIESKMRLSYERAQAVIDGDAGDVPGEVAGLLRDMNTLARAIEKRRVRKGQLQLPMPEMRVVMDEDGRVTGIRPEDGSYSHTIIEMFMVEANVAVASLLDRYCVPFMRRVHGDPGAEALRMLSQTLRLLGVTLSRKASRFDLQAMLRRVRGTRVELPVNMLVLRSLARAVYSPLSVGHYALAAPKYCHFTSPIRRYADLTVHRALDEYLAGRVDRARRLYAVSDLVKIGEHISQTEQLAEDAENEVKRVLVLHFLTGHVGEQFDGVVTGLTRFGASVFLPEYGVEGLLRPEALGPDHWQFDEQSQCLIGRHTGGMLRLAQNLAVRIVEVHPAARRLDLAPAGSLPSRKSRRGKSSRSRRGHRDRNRRVRRGG